VESDNLPRQALPVQSSSSSSFRQSIAPAAPPPQVSQAQVTAAWDILWQEHETLYDQYDAGLELRDFVQQMRIWIDRAKEFVNNPAHLGLTTACSIDLTNAIQSFEAAIQGQAI